MSHPLFLRSGNATPVNLCQTNIILCSEKKRQGPEDLSSSKVQVLTERRQISVGSSLKPRSPGPTLLSSTKGARHPTQLALRLLRPPKLVCVEGGGQVPPTVTQADSRVAETGMGRGSPLPRGLDSTSGLEPCRTQPLACSLGPPAHLLAQGRGTDRRAPGRRPGSGP